ncbi:hypothetical protein APS56_10685 [Pseudalgibacter alginicilyticus]|uniref:Uncharacterized protein n=1 Tax=Pseudalgibacter alginicilyticus TaxID=1736674 RepID=A0A0P0CHC6_9FLAO|nr:DUF6168 family protein [Pseudalgibacter alginicilyticus]ALJ05559.1 hypothetical protein APS56_10685 [Pseudalgibacter alginicilyticus]
MIKRILFVVAIFLLLFLISYNLHNYFLNSTPSYSLLDVYLFHVIAAIIVYVIVELVFSVLPNQTGYAYLALIFLKIGLFVLIFQNSIFSNDNLTQLERIGLIVPLFLFLISEAVSVSKLLVKQ